MGDGIACMGIVTRSRLNWALFAAYATCAGVVAGPCIDRRIRAGTIDARLAVALRSLFSPWRSRGPVAAVADFVERRRADLSRRPGCLTVLGAGERLLENTAPRLAYYASVPPRWGRFLFHCADATGARTIVEVGACVGISGSYLASARSCRTFVTFEPGAALAELAEASIQQVRPGSQIVRQRFADGFDRVMPLLEDGVDLAYIDSSHDEASTVGPAMRLTPYLNPGGILLLDDIRWSSVMWRNWQTVRHHRRVSSTVDLGRMGLCVWGGDVAPPRHHDLSRLLGWWRVEKRNPSPRAGSPS